MSGRTPLSGLLSAAILAALTIVGRADEKTSHGSPPTAPVARVLRWFPPDTEAFAVANGPIELKRSLNDVEQELSLVEAGTIFACSRVSLLQEGTLFKNLRGLKVDAIVDGRRRFQVTVDQGTGHCDGCQILLAAEGEGPKLTRAFQAWIAAGRSTIQVEDQTAVLVEEKVDGDEIFRALFAHPLPEVLICASTPSHLREVLSRMRDETKPSAFPSDRIEWKMANCQAPFWGVRRFDPQGREKDMTSPFNKRAPIADSKAIGFTFAFGAGNPKAMEVIYLSNSRNAASLLAAECFDKDEFRINRIAESAFRIQMVKDDEQRERFEHLLEVLTITGFLRAI